ncbi:MAG TPA: RICIN domain-containing protein [Nonomuraea sp.]|nr:RICIN domain-containing protein [Nonomuraea sp.]
MVKHRIKTIAVFTAVIAATAGMAVSASAASASSPPPVPAWAPLWLVNVNSGKCLTIAGGGTGDNIYANQYTCDSHAARKWWFIRR